MHLKILGICFIWWARSSKFDPVPFIYCFIINCFVILCINCSQPSVYMIPLYLPYLEIQTIMDNAVFTIKNKKKKRKLHVSGLTRFKPVWFKGQLYTLTNGSVSLENTDKLLKWSLSPLTIFAGPFVVWFWLQPHCSSLSFIFYQS